MCTSTKSRPSLCTSQASLQVALQEETEATAQASANAQALGPLLQAINEGGGIKGRGEICGHEG